MPHLPFHEQQLEFIIALTKHRIEFLNPFFRFLHYFDSPYFFFVLIPFIWIGFSYRWGIRVFYWFMLNNLTIVFAKQGVGWPRPSTDLPEIGLYHPSSYGFPSGGAQTCFFLGGLLIYYWGTRAAWIIGSVYIFLISFSRLYLGVHYPIDILGGWILGGLLLTLFIAIKAPLEKWLAKQGSFFCLLCGLILPSVILVLAPKTGYQMGSVMGISLGIYFSLRYRLFLPTPKTWAEGVGRAFIGVAILFLVIFLWPGEQTYAKSFVAGLFMSLVASPICKWFIDRPCA